MFKCEEKLLTTAVLKLVLLHDPWASSILYQILYQNQSLYIFGQQFLSWAIYFSVSVIMFVWIDGKRFGCSEWSFYDLSRDWLFPIGLCGGFTAGLLSLDTLSSDEASPVLFITHVLSGLPDVLITQLSDCWNIWAYMRPLPLLPLYLCPSKCLKLVCKTVQRLFSSIFKILFMWSRCTLM